MPWRRCLPTVLFLSCLAGGLCAAEPAVVLTDPVGDDHGDGHLVYPSQQFRPGDLDLVAFRATNEGDEVQFEVEFAERIRTPRRGAADELGTDFQKIARHGFYQFNVDIYIDTDRRPRSGFTQMLPGRLAVVDPGTAWDVAVVAVPRPGVIEGQLRGLMEDRVEDARRGDVPVGVAPGAVDAWLDESTRLVTRVVFPGHFKVRGTKLQFSVPQDVLGGPARPDWAYTVVVTGADLVNSLDLGASVGFSEETRSRLGVLPISPGEWRNRFGGGRPGEPLQPPIVDTIVPPGESQEYLLGDFDSQDGRPARLVGVVPAEVGGAAAASGTEPRWRVARFDGRVFYEIFVRSFRDSDGDGIGDFNGILAALDYLNDGDPATTDDLGIEGIWLMPVFASPSYHGYDTTDYYALNPDYGTLDDFSRLLAACHERGISVVLDLMLNHTSDQHPWFVESSAGPDAPRRDWYVWRADDPGWTQPWGSGPVWHAKNGWYYYGIFWSGMPDLNFRTDAVRRETERIAAFWLDRGVDGFRLDAARHLIAAGPGELQNDTPETHAYWREFSGYLRENYPEALMLGEIWAGTETIAPYYGDAASVQGGDEFAMTFDFALAGGIVAAVNLGDANAVTSVLTRLDRLYPEGVLDGTFLANHDMTRLATQLGDDPARLRQAAAILLTLPGTPFLYYGEEVGLRNGPAGGDEAKRTPMPWTAATGGGFTGGAPWHPFAPGRETANVATQTDDPASLLSRYRTLIRLRRDNPALRQGTVTPVAVDGQPRGVLAYVREAAGQRVLVVHNLAAAAASCAWRLEPAAGEYRRLFGDQGVGVPAGDALTLPARATGVWELR